jgi:hypothetical protein
MNRYENILEGYKERVGRIALFDLFYAIDKKQKTDREGRPIDHFGVYLLTLLFFFENMLQRNKNISVRTLAQFLKEMIHHQYVLEEQDYLDLARSLVEAMRPPSGRRNRREFYNYETQKDDFIEYSILKVSGWDKENNVQYYALDEQGLELIFATKEYFSEFQISISQLILRKQLEKGEFVGALRQIDEMRVGVNTIKEKIIQIKHEVQRNIVSDETYERYKDLVDDINRRLKREHEEFEEIGSFVQETKSHYERSRVLSDKDQSAFSMVIRIDNELSDVHHLHSGLLQESIELKMTALESARESLYFIGLSSFNFDQEIVRKMMTLPMPVEETEVIAHPYLGLGRAKIWSPMALFAPQWIKKDGEETAGHLFLELGESAKEKSLRVQQRIYKQIFEEVQPILEKQGQIHLQELGNHLTEKYIQVRETYDFFIILHQMSPVDLRAIKEQPDHVFYEAFKKLPQEYRFIQALEERGLVALDSNYEMRNMEITLLDKEPINHE